LSTAGGRIIVLLMHVGVAAVVGGAVLVEAVELIVATTEFVNSLLVVHLVVWIHIWFI
jgi:hypothetical protein